MSPAGRPYDAAKRKKAVRPLPAPGIRVYIPPDVLKEAGIDDAATPLWYRLAGHRRSARGASVIVSLYREP